MTADLLSFPLFYRRPTPLDHKRDAKASLPPRRDLAFAAGTNSVPLVMGELAESARCYPILFSTGAKPVPIALVGLVGDANLYTRPAADGSGVTVWEESFYVPGYVRRYPFILMETGAADRFTVCADADGLSDAEGAVALFEADGAPTEAAQKAVEFCKLYHAEYARTREWVDALQAADLLVEHQATITLSADRTMTFSGFKVVDGPRFDALPDATILDWRQRGWLAPIYLHHASLLNWDRLIARSAAVAKAP